MAQNFGGTEVIKRELHDFVNLGLSYYSDRDHTYLGLISSRVAFQVLCFCLEITLDEDVNLKSPQSPFKIQRTYINLFISTVFYMAEESQQIRQILNSSLYFTLLWGKSHKSEVWKTAGHHLFAILVTIITEILKSERLFCLFDELTKGFLVLVCPCCMLFSLNHILVLAHIASRFPRNCEWIFFFHMGNIISACQGSLHSP